MTEFLQLKEDYSSNCIDQLKEVYIEGGISKAVEYITGEREKKRACQNDAGVIVDNIHTLTDSQIIIYTDSQKQNWCFEREAIPTLYKTKKNPWTGKKLPASFIKTLEETVPVKAVTLQEGFEAAFADKTVIKPPLFPPSKKTGFEGATKTELAMVLYLLYKFPNACVPIIFDQSKLQGGLLSTIMGWGTEKIGLHDFAMVWRATDEGWKLNKPSVFVDEIKKCDKRFVIVYLPLLGGKVTAAGKVKLPGAHANILIYDKDQKVLERFEPHGSISSSVSKLFNVPDLDKELQKFASKLGAEYYRPLDFCPKQGPQGQQEHEKVFAKYTGKKEGFCAAWSFWYVILRMSNPDVSRTGIIEKALQSIKTSYDDYTQYIIDFGSFFEDVNGLTYAQLDKLARTLASKI